MDLEILKAVKTDAEEITALLNTVTIKLHNNNIKQWTYPWKLKEIESDIRHVYIMKKDGSIIGTFSVKNNDVTTFPAEKDSLYLYRVALLPEYQGKSIGLKIIKYVFSLNVTVHLDCWAGNSALKKFYLTAGFTYCGDFPENNYMISVFKHTN